MYQKLQIPRTIVLVGMMGVGKTSIGRRLAKALDVKFQDSDHEIEKASGCSVKDVYELYGECAFKDVERRIIRRLLDERPHVLSTGVGAFVDEENRQLIFRKGFSIWLDASAETLIPRVTRRDHRPQLESSSEAKEDLLNEYIKDYYPIYTQADFRVNCDDKLPDQTVVHIIRELNSNF